MKRKIFPSAALIAFLKQIEEAKEKFPQDKELILSLEEAYMNAWNGHAESRAIGAATGAAFERWIKKQLNNKYKGSKKVNLGSFEFNADIVIPNSKNPKVILEVKICVGSFQTLLFCAGLLALSEIKLGLILFHEITGNFKAILEKINKRFQKKFGYFCIGSGWFQLGEERGELCWSQTIKKIKSFIENSLNESLC